MEQDHHTITIVVDGKFYNISRMINGVLVSERDARVYSLQHHVLGVAYPDFQSASDAAHAQLAFEFAAEAPGSGIDTSR